MSPSQRSLARAAGAVVGAGVLARLASGLLGSRPLAAELLGLFLVDWASTRVGADVHREIARRGASGALLSALRGALLGAGAAAMTAGAGVALGQAYVAGVSFGAASIGFGLLHAAVVGLRDELLYRAIPRAVTEPLAGARASLVFCVLAGAAPTLLAAREAPLAPLLAAALGSLTASALFRTGEVLPAAGARAAVVFFCSTVFSSLVDVRWRSGALVLLERASGPGALALSLLLLAAAASAWRLLPAGPAARA